jgi:hypothetical protein
MYVHYNVGKDADGINDCWDEFPDEATFEEAAEYDDEFAFALVALGAFVFV